MKNMVVKQVSAGEHDVLLFLHTSRAPSSEEWDEAMELVAKYARRGDLRLLRVLAVSDGGGPDASMRGTLREFYETNRHWLKTAVITTSLITRGIVAAVSWFNPHVKAFSPGELRNVFAHLDLRPSFVPRILRELAEMQRELPMVACLELVHGLSDGATP